MSTHSKTKFVKPRPHITGAGLNYINEFYDGLIADQAQNIKWLEVRPENYLDRGGLGIRMLDAIHEIYPFVGHTVSLSVGSPDPLDWEHLHKIKNFIKKYKIPYLTDHLGTCTHKGLPYQMLLPLPWTQAVAHYVAERARIIQDFLEVPFGLENLVCYNFTSPPQMSEAEFINEAIEKSGCCLLLDLNDVVINGHNYDFSAVDFLKTLNTKSLVEIHVAGYHKHESGFYEGTHGEAVSEDVFDILGQYAKQHKLPPLLLEWEVNIPEFAVIRKQVQRLNSLLTEGQPLEVAS